MYHGKDPRNPKRPLPNALRQLPDAQARRSKPESIHVSPVALAHYLVPGLESLPEGIGCAIILSVQHKEMAPWDVAQALAVIESS